MNLTDKLNEIASKKKTMDEIFNAVITSKSFKQLYTELMRNGELPEFIFSGVGKNWYICEKVVKTFLSMGIKARALDCTHALHGDLGMLSGENNKVLFFISRSGTTAEVVKLAKIVKRLKQSAILHNVYTVGFSLSKDKPFEYLYNTTLVPDDVSVLDKIYEFDHRDLVPSLSIDIMQLVLDLLGVIVYESNPKLVENYVYNHLSGANGEKLGGGKILAGIV